FSGGAATLYAQWTLNASFTVTFNNNGGTGTMANETDNTPTALTTNSFTRTGYTFAGWNTVAGGGGTAYADGATYPFTASVTLYAQWTANASFTVTFNANGGTGTMANETDNVPTALTTNTFTRVGYTFSGWNTVAGGGGTAYADGATYPFTASVTLYAQWTVNGSFTVTFNANLGTGTMANETDNSPTALTTNTFTRTGYTFTGWAADPGGGGAAYANGATYPFTASITLYAQWMANGGGGGGGGTTAPTLTVKTAGGTVSYGTAFTPASTVSAGLLTGDTATVSTATYTYSGAGTTTYAASTTVPTAVGTYNVTPSAATVVVTPAADQTKYSATYVYVGGTLTITAATLTVTAGNVSITVGGTITPTSTVSGVVGTDTAAASNVVYTYTGTGSTTYAASTTAPTAAGTYSITPSGATIAVTPAADAADYSTTDTYVAGTLTITAKVTPPPPVVLHAGHIVGSILLGRHSIVIVGTGFSGQPKITGTTKGIKVSVSKDTGSRLTVWVTVPKGTRAGHGTFTIRLANGKSCKITYTIK
ncbi:MAG: InlB B-repeat-containing protein, partial [Acidimicrobiales bacterium]